MRRGPRVVLVDSITQLDARDAGAVVVTGSHGGTSSGEIALRFAVRGVFFNDAGVGKDHAGIAALAMFQERRIAAGTVAHTSARIGDAQDMWHNGVISHVNAAGHALGWRPGAALRATLLD